MRLMPDKGYEKHRQDLTGRLNGRTPTPDGLRILCAGFENDPERIGRHMPEKPAK